MVSPYYPNQVPWTDKENYVSPEDPRDLVEADHINQLYAEVNAIGQDFVTRIPYATATGSANAYTITLQPAPASYKEGMAVAVKIHATNTGASTININGLGAKGIRKANGNNVSAGNLKAGSIYSMRYNGANFILQGSDSSGNAIPGDVLAGKTFSNDEDTNLTGTLALSGNANTGDVLTSKTFYNTDAKAKKTGTMPNRGAVVITPGTSNQTIAAGYHNGSGYVVGDSDLIAANIRQGKNIYGVTGTYKSSIIPSDTIQISANTERVKKGNSFTKLKEIRVGYSGQVKVKYEMTQEEYNWCYGSLRINGDEVDLFTLKDNATYGGGVGWKLRETIIEVTKNDLIQLYARTNEWDRDVGVRNFRLCYSIIEATNDVVLLN